MNQPVPDELISAYFDGEVSPEERNRIEHLLESDSDLRLQLDDTSKLSALLHSFPREAAPEGLVSSVQHRVAAVVLAAPLTGSASQVAVALHDASVTPTIGVGLSAHTPDVSPAPATRRSLRREWTAFGAGMMATMASLLVFVTFQRSSWNFESKTTASTADHPSEHRLSESVVAQRSTDSLRFLKSGDTIPNGRIESLAMGETSERVVDLPSAVEKNEMPVGLGRAADSPDGIQGVPRQEPGFDPNFNGGFGLFSNAFPVQGFSDAADDQSLTMKELLDSMRDGQVIRKISLDPNNTVMVVEITVVDVEQFLGEVRVVLQKRSVPQVNDLEVAMSKPDQNLHSTDLASNKSSKSSALKEDTPDRDKRAFKRSSTSDGLFAIYLQASGSQLSETLTSISAIPQNSFNLVPRLPIELRREAVARLSDSVASNSESKFTETSPVPNDMLYDQPVVVEAKLAVDNYANANGLSVDGENKSTDSLNEKSSLPLDELIANKDGIPTDRAELALESPPPAGNQSSRNSTNRDVAALSNSEKGLSSGYATFHLALDDQQRGRGQVGKQGSDQNLMTANQPARGSHQLSNQAVSNNLNPFAGNTFNGNTPSASPNYNFSRQRTNRPSNNDQALMKMLIVLKPEQAAPASPSEPSPSP